jgi:hypothetical protein
MNWLKLILTYFPVVLQMVVAVEAELKTSPGMVKKQVVMAVLSGAPASSVGVAQQIPDAHIADIGKLVDVTATAVSVITKPLAVGVEVKAQ